MNRLLPLIALAFASCTYNAHGARVGDWYGTVTNENCEWIDRPPSEFAHVYDVTLEEWIAAGLPTPTIKNTEVCWLPETTTPADGMQAYVAGSTRRHVTLSVRHQASVGLEQSLIAHELLHVFRLKAGIGYFDGAHADERLWVPFEGSLEERITRRLWNTP